MPKFCAKLTMLWNDLEFTDRFAAAAKGAFEGVEYLFRYAHDRSRLAVITQGIRRHSAIRRNRNALPITDTELRLMAALAIMGLRSRPVTG